MGWHAVQEDGTAGDDSEEEGSAEAKSESLGSDIDSEAEDEEGPASRRLNVRTGQPSPSSALYELRSCEARAKFQLLVSVVHTYSKDK